MFWPRRPKQGIQFDLPCPKKGIVCEQSLSFPRLRIGPCEKMKEFAIERTSDAFLFLICIRSTE